MPPSRGEALSMLRESLVDCRGDWEATWGSSGTLWGVPRWGEGGRAGTQLVEFEVWQSSGVRV